MASFTGQRQQCPACAEQGRDTSADNLQLRDDGSGFCFSCSKSFTARDLNSDAPRKSKFRLTDVESLPVGHDPVRNISEDVVKSYDVRASVNTADGTVQRVYYPYKHGYKARTLPKDFLAIGEPKGLFWPKDVPEQPQCSLVLTEGEEDAMAVAEILSKCKKHHIAASVGNGTSVDRSVMTDLDRIKKFRKVYVWMDNDEPGELAAKKLAELLAPEVREVYVVPCVPADTTIIAKDASEYVQAHDYIGGWKRITSAEKFEPEGVVDGADVDINELMESVPEGEELPFPITQSKLHGLRKAEITTICAGSGIGKTTLAKEIGYDLVTKGHTVCHIPLEDLVKTTQQAYIAMDNNIPWQRLRTQPYMLPRAQWERSKDEIISKMFFFRHFGSINPDELIRKIEYYVHAKQVDYIILDHLSMVVSGLDVSNERKSIDIIMTKLAELVVRTGVGLIQIVHLKRRNGDLESFGDGGKPSLSDLRGSASLEQLSWNVIALARDQQANDGSEDLCTIHILKNRTWGFTGECDTLRFNHMTGRMEVANTDPESDGTEGNTDTSDLEDEQVNEQENENG